MKILKHLLYFFGNVYFAIALIAVTTIFVIAGTFIESKTESHLLAARWTYESPFFLLLLSLFFINILFAALRRWPFKNKHIPFLITHLGLLMVISGTIVKNRWGLQGQMTVWEGSGNQHLVIPNSHSLLIEKNGKTPYQSSAIALHNFHTSIYHPFHFPQLKCKLIGFAPHVKQEYKTWIKGPQAYITGFPPIPVHEWNASKPFPKEITHHFSRSTYFPKWSLLALRIPGANDTQEAIKEAYLHNLILIIKNVDYPEEILTLPLQKALSEKIEFSDGNIIIDLKLTQLNQNKPFLSFTWEKNELKESFFYPLEGHDALILKPVSDSWSKPLFTIDLIRNYPKICLIEDSEENTHFFAFDIHGRIHEELFPSSQLNSLISYDQGFRGYNVQAILPIASFPSGREDKQKANAAAFVVQMKEALKQNTQLSPPLQIFKQACHKAQVDFTTTFVQYLMEWQRAPYFLLEVSNRFPNEILKMLTHLNWNPLSDTEKQSILWTRQILIGLNESWKGGESPMEVLKKNHWPLIKQLIEANCTSNENSFLNLLSQQIASLSHYLPKINFPLLPTLKDNSEFLSAYFRIHGIDEGLIQASPNNDKEDFTSLEQFWSGILENSHLQQNLVFETPLSLKITPQTPPDKLEDRRPGIVLKFQEGLKEQSISLAYDSTLTELKWPLFEGSYRIRFQPKLEELPYRVRLRQARQILYPQSNQTYSYESDVSITENKRNHIERVTLSMNRVYETWDGFRFYLAGIGMSGDSSLKRIQLAVNYDPAKYFLTYPGALLVFIGTLSLFWFFKKFR